jgi:hypothetical protein
MAMFFFYAGRTYTSTASGSKTKIVTCESCRNPYKYEVRGTATGSGHSVYYFDNKGAAERAREKALQDLQASLETRVGIVHCPTCGIFQKNMLPLIRSSEMLDYNAHAALRVQKSESDLLRETKEAGTIDAYLKFLSVWPHGHARAEVSRLLDQKRSAIRRAEWKAGPGPLIAKGAAALAVCAFVGVFLVGANLPTKGSAIPSAVKLPSSTTSAAASTSSTASASRPATAPLSLSASGAPSPLMVPAALPTPPPIAPLPPVASVSSPTPPITRVALATPVSAKASNKVLRSTFRQKSSVPFTVVTPLGTDDYVLKLAKVSNQQELVLFYVQSASRFSVNVPPGKYVIRGVHGPRQKAGEDLFGDSGTFFKSVQKNGEDKFELTTGRSYTLRLIGQIDGNVQSPSISRNEF